MSKVKFLVAVMLSVLVAACSEEENLSQAGKTGFHVSLTEDVKVDSRSTPEELSEPLASQFNLKITNQATGNTVHDALFKGKEGETEFIPAAAGMYDIEATYGENPVLALDDPYYKGMAKDVVLADGEQKTVKIECEVANALASVKFSDDFAKQFSDYGVEVLVSGNRTTIKGKESAYYRAGSTPSFTFKGITTKGEIVEQLLQNDEFNKSATFAAKAHCKISLTIGAVVPGIRVDINKVEVDSVTVSETIPMEWLPKPKVTAEGFDNNALSMYETETPTAKFNFNLSSVLQELKFTLNFTDETYQALNKTYTLSELSEEDKTALTEAGVVLPTIGLKEATLDFTGLAAKLTGSTTGEVLSNVITLDEVKANNRVLEGNQTYTIQTSAPDFNLVVYPGNIWTKQFTANTEITHGNAEVIRNGMTFEYRPVGTEEWISSPDSIIDGLPQDKEKETAYQVRGKFGKHYTEVVDAKTYPAIPLANGGLEDYSKIKGEDKTSSQYGAQYEWTNWCTLNDLTCDKCVVLFVGNTAFNSRSGTRPSNIVREESDGNTSAWISTIGFGYGGTSYEKVVPGELYLGTLTNVNHDEDTATKNYGINFISRPKALHFYYMYAPYEGDQSDIYIQILGKDGNILGTAVLNETQSVSSYKECTLDIVYDDKNKELEPEKLVIVFKSGSNTSVEARGDTGVTGSGDPAYRGSELYIDDVELVYSK